MATEAGTATGSVRAAQLGPLDGSIATAAQRVGHGRRHPLAALLLHRQMPSTATTGVGGWVGAPGRGGGVGGWVGGWVGGGGVGWGGGVNVAHLV